MSLGVSGYVPLTRWSVLYKNFIWYIQSHLGISEYLKWQTRRSRPEMVRSARARPDNCPDPTDGGEAASGELRSQELPELNNNSYNRMAVLEVHRLFIDPEALIPDNLIPHANS